MSLVPYDGSDISDSEEEAETNNLQEKVEQKSETVQNTEISDGISNNSLFNLPTPKAAYSEVITEEENDEFLQKKPEKNLQEKKPVKITIPSLSQFDEDEISNNIPFKKFRPASTKGTGLFSILPPPKTGSNTSLVPQSVKKPKPVQTPLVPRAIKKQVEEKLKQKIDLISTKDQTNGVTHDDDDDDNDTGTDFFSLDKPEPEYYPELPEEEDKHAEVVKPSVEPMPSASQYIPLVANEDVSQFESNQVVDNRLGLDEAALKALIGSKGKRKLETASAQILDLHEHDIKPDNKEWYQNALLQGTGPEEQEAVKAVPGGILKRKHQITYLAQQAKANEQQLKNLWAQNRATRQQTQSKYGF